MTGHTLKHNLSHSESVNPVIDLKIEEWPICKWTSLSVLLHVGHHRKWSGSQSKSLLQQCDVGRRASLLLHTSFRDQTPGSSTSFPPRCHSLGKTHVKLTNSGFWSPCESARTGGWKAARSLEILREPRLYLEFSHFADNVIVCLNNVHSYITFLCQIQ